jgi:PhnB protein
MGHIFLGGVMAKAKKKKAVSKKKAARKVAKKVQPIPARYSSVIPSFRVKNAAGAVEFMQKLFGAKVIDRYDGPNGELMHAEVKIGNVVLMCADGMGQAEQTLASCVYVKNVDQVVQKALALGATEVEAVETKFYGDRAGRVRDQWGNDWWIATHVEDVSKKEMMKRMAAMQQHGHQQAA